MQDSGASSPVPAALPFGSWRRALICGVCYYFLTSLVVVAGIEFGREFVLPSEFAQAQSRDFVDCLAGRAGPWYGGIAARGYSYTPNARSNIVFPPAYPVAARMLIILLGVRPAVALLIVSNLCCAGIFVLLYRYARELSPKVSERRIHWMLASFGLLPTTLFFRMAYSEAPFALVCLLVLYGMERRWPPLALALISGAGIATRIVGVALLPVLWVHLCGCDSAYGFRRSNVRAGPGEPDDMDISTSYWAPSVQGRRIWTTFVYTLIASSGLIGFVIWQWLSFNNPFAFASNQRVWATRTGAMSETVASLITLEPLWAVYRPGSLAYWGDGPTAVPLFSIMFLNPIVFGGTTVLLFLLAAKGYATRKQTVLASLLLLIPYATIAYGHRGAGMGRFATVALPVLLPAAVRMFRTHLLIAVGIIFGALGLFFLSSMSATWHHVL